MGHEKVMMAMDRGVCVWMGVIIELVRCTYDSVMWCVVCLSEVTCTIKFGSKRYNQGHQFMDIPRPYVQRQNQVSV
jgi:hypothetical protein